MIFDKNGRLWRETFPAFYLLLGFSFELALKSMLAADGMLTIWLIAVAVIIALVWWGLSVRKLLIQVRDELFYLNSERRAAEYKKRREAMSAYFSAEQAL